MKRLLLTLTLVLASVGAFAQGHCWKCFTNGGVGGGCHEGYSSGFCDCFNLHSGCEVSQDCPIQCETHDATTLSEFKAKSPDKYAHMVEALKTGGPGNSPLQVFTSCANTAQRWTDVAHDAHLRIELHYTPRPDAAVAAIAIKDHQLPKLSVNQP